MNLEDLTTVAGYECPKTTSKTARRVLQHLGKGKVVVCSYDDGPSQNVKDELVTIAGAIGLMYFDKPHQLVLIDVDETLPLDKWL